jgi:hypothetical protein
MEQYCGTINVSGFGKLPKRWLNGRVQRPSSGLGYSSGIKGVETMAQRLKLASWALGMVAGLALTQMNLTADAAPASVTMSKTQPAGRTCGWMPGPNEYAVWGCL